MKKVPNFISPTKSQTLSFTIAACIAGSAGIIFAADQAPGIRKPATDATAAKVTETAIGPLDRVSVDVFAQLLSDATGRPFAVSDNIVEKFTVVVPRGAAISLPADEVYAFGISVLASAGLSVLEEGNACRIVRLPEGGGLSIGSTDDASANIHGLVTRVFRLKHVAADKVRAVLEGGSGKKGWIAVLESSNILVVTDTTRTLERVEKIVEELDKPGLSRKTEIVKLAYADAESLASQLNMVVEQTKQSENSLLQQRLTTGNGNFKAATLVSGVAIPAPRSNSLILVGQESQISEFRTLISSLDVDVPTGRGNLHSLPLKYLNAADIAKNISSLLEKSAAKASGAAGKEVRKISVEASPVNNSLIVDAAPSDFAAVKELVARLDVLPGQVHVAVMIAEVTDSDGFTWNPKLTSLDVPAQSSKTGISAGSRMAADSSSIIAGAAEGILPQGLTMAIAHRDSSGNLAYPGIVGFEAVDSDSKIKILSETSLQAQNNIEAELKIVDDIPYLKSSVEGSGSDRDYIQNVDRMEVGVTLKFTPYIVNEPEVITNSATGTYVRMNLEPTIASVISTDASSLNPTIAKRSAKTIVTVPDGNTIVIAGLTRTTKRKVQNKIPVLGSIPLLGWLFRYESEVEEKTNLLIFVTPTVITNPSDAVRPTEEWKRKTGISGSVESDTKAEDGESSN